MKSTPDGGKKLVYSALDIYWKDLGMKRHGIGKKVLSAKLYLE